MLQLLKHTAVRSWLALVFGGPLSLMVLAYLPPRPGAGWPLTISAAVLAAVFVFLGWAGNQLAGRAVRRLLADSDIWERAGRYDQARTALRRAVAVYDSFLPSPLARSGIREGLTARLARFYLARPDKDAAGLAGLRTYLDAHPGDRTVAKAWLRWLDRQESAAGADEALADRIAEAQPDDAGVQQILGRRCLAAGRTDFSALEIYRRVMRRDAQAAVEWGQRLATLFLNEGRADDFALETYLAAWPQGNRSELRRGLAACLFHLAPEVGNREMLARARGLLGKLDAVDLEILAEGFKGPVSRPSVRPQRPAETLDRIRRAAAAAGGLGRFLGRGLGRLRASRAARRTVYGLGLAGTGVVAAVLLYNTFGHLFEPPVAPPEPAVQESPEQAVTDPFTIQVAAYLKREQAERYVSALRRRDIDAYWQEARSNDKSWYQVRVSHFPDKAAALAYGESLKRQAVIDDFYVANYARP
jgi:hypothetical protein